MNNSKEVDYLGLSSRNSLSSETHKQVAPFCLIEYINKNSAVALFIVILHVVHYMQSAHNVHTYDIHSVLTVKNLLYCTYKAKLCLLSPL